jgi:hypothetical protein
MMLIAPAPSSAQAMDARMAQQAHAQGTSTRASHIITLAWCGIQVAATHLRDSGAPLSVFELQAAMGFTLMLTMSTTGVLALLRDSRVAAATTAQLAALAAAADEAEAGAHPALDAALAAIDAAELGAYFEISAPALLPAPLARGRLYTFMGPSGSGKSQALDALAGQPGALAPGGEERHLTLGGVAVPVSELRSAAWRRVVAYMPQTATTELPPLPVWALLRRGAPAASRALAREVCLAFGLDKLNLSVNLNPSSAAAGGDDAAPASGRSLGWEKALLRVCATNLSAGQKQRVALALFFLKGTPCARARTHACTYAMPCVHSIHLTAFCACDVCAVCFPCVCAVLSTNPLLALMDEPTSSLDGRSTEEVEHAARVRARTHARNAHACIDALTRAFSVAQALRQRHPSLRTAFLIITHNPDSLFRADAAGELLMGGDGVIGMRNNNNGHHQHNQQHEGAYAR